MGRNYSQLELIQMIKLPPTTVKRWLTHFALFIPTVKIGDSVAYKYETLTLLKRIKALRTERYHLGTIVRILIEEGFPLYNSDMIAGRTGGKKPGKAVGRPSASSRIPEMDLSILAPDSVHVPAPDTSPAPVPIPDPTAVQALASAHAPAPVSVPASHTEVVIPTPVPVQHVPAEVTFKRELAITLHTLAEQINQLAAHMEQTGD
jgi:hypothetical protein